MNYNKISIFIPSFRIGGAEKVLVILANGLLAHFNEVQILTCSMEGPLKDELDPAVKHMDFGGSSYKSILFKLRSYFDAERPDVVITSIYATGLVASAARLLSRHKPVLLIGAHNSFTAKVASPDNIKDKYLLRPMSRILFQRAEAIVSVSRGVSEDIARSLGLKEEKLHVIYNPVVSPLMIQMSKEVLQHPWLCHRLDRNYKTLLSVGRLVEQKGISLLIDAFAILPNREQYRLVIVGDGPLASHLKHKVQMHGIELLVDFIGYDSNPYRFMSRADLFVLASSWEGLANVLIEAMACGCPVVSTDCPYGPNEILEGGKYGQLVPVNDVKALSVAIFESLNCNSIEVSSNDLIRRANYFTHVRATNAYVDLIKKLVFQKSIAT